MTKEDEDVFFGLFAGGMGTAMLCTGFYVLTILMCPNNYVFDWKGGYCEYTFTRTIETTWDIPEDMPEGLYDVVITIK